MPAFLHNFILSFLDTEYCTQLAFACFQALPHHRRSVREAGRESRRVYVLNRGSPAHQQKKDTLARHSTIKTRCLGVMGNHTYKLSTCNFFYFKFVFILKRHHGTSWDILKNSVHFLFSTRLCAEQASQSINVLASFPCARLR